MNSNYIIDIKYTNPILEWVLNKNNRDKHITEEPEHEGYAVFRDNIYAKSKNIIKNIIKNLIKQKI